MKMNCWISVQKEKSYGIAIYNFEDINDKKKLKLTVGDAVSLLEEEDNWYYGYVVGDRNATGVFPKNYVHVKPMDTSSRGEPPIVNEITSVLREWGVHLKHLYVSHSENFETMRNKINDLLILRSKIVSGTLPVDELKRVTRQAIEEIDMGNKTLGLDLVVRDKNGNLINPEVTSTLQLYYLHKNATERMTVRTKPEEKDSQPKTAIQQYSNIFILSVRNFTCKMLEDAELLITLYDGREFKPITEYYVVPWKKEGLMSDLDQMNNLRVMFTDLGKRDLEREKIYLVCNVIRMGAMDAKEVDHRRSSVSAVMNNNKKNTFENMRRPCGVAALDITNYMNGKLDIDLEQEISIPFVSCEKDTLEQTLRKVVSKEKIENKNQALFVSMQLLRGDLKQVREENPHLVLGNVSIARKMGFPEVILPGDVRNDLYLTLISGEFTRGNKKSEKNVEVVITVCNQKGEPIPGVISLGGGVSPIDEYRSVIYYHEDKPQWFETFKVAIPIEEFKISHLKFTFKHRSSNEAKDKSEKPFAMAYVKLMQGNGTTLCDAKHNLVVYKIDWKKFNVKNLEYLTLPTMVEELKEMGNNKLQVQGLSVSTKDSFTISSNICSTKLTQNVDLLGLLNWSSHKETLQESLQALMKVDGEEVVKFLQDILDALFTILMDDPETDTYDILVFECLLYIISLVSNDWKYQHFEPVLDLYIKESFSATLAYKKLITVLTSVVSKAYCTTGINSKDTSLLFKTMKSLQYVIRFVSKSRSLYEKLNSPTSDEDDFKYSIKNLLSIIINMMSLKVDGLLREQGACLKYFPSTIPDILEVFDEIHLSHSLCELLRSIPDRRLTKQKMMTINEIVHSKLFLDCKCRQIMMPLITKQVKDLIERKEEGLSKRQDGRRQNRSVAKVAQLLGTTERFVNQHVGYPEEVELCIKILSDILDLLFNLHDQPVDNDIRQIIEVNLRTIIQHHIKIEKDNPNGGNLVAVMIDIFRQMTEEHYNNYISGFHTPIDILDFLTEILVVFKELVSTSVFPADWCDMILLQNSIILKLLRFFSHTIRDRFFNDFEYDVWSNFFHCAIAFMTQPALQLENFSMNKRLRIINKYKDMRRETGFEIKSMWFNLGLNKVKFVPTLVGLILEMTLIPEVELRKATIPIFFDMMQCEFYSSKLEQESYGNTKWDSSHIKGNFGEFENEMIAKLDMLFEGGKGDEQFKDLFSSIMKEHCNQHTTMKEYGIKFVNIVTVLMKNLLEYREIILEENMENRMSCTVTLLEFYAGINRKEMYIRYLIKLFDLHLECDNYTEAAYTLELYTNLLQWSDEPLSTLLKCNKFPCARTHRQLKEELYYVIIQNYSKGKMWECAITKCQELADQFKDYIFDYVRLSELHRDLSKFYEDIIRHVRPKPEYFRVGYFGRGFPPFLQNKVFIYRGKEYERLADFNSRILNEFSKAELLNKLTPPGEEILNSDKQYIQINKVDPIMDEKKQRFSGKPVSDQIVQFYRVNNIQKFSFCRPYTKRDELLNTENEFAHLWLERTEMTTTCSLPGILRWFPVQHTEVSEISPLRIAIETMEKINKTLQDFITTYNKDNTVQLSNLQLTLTGIVDPAVMGGIRNYEEAFFETEYEKVHPEDAVLIQSLKMLIVDQIPLLDLCLQIHQHKILESPNLKPLHDRLENCLVQLKMNVEKKYGKGICKMKLENNDVQVRRRYSMSNSSDKSDLSLTSTDKSSQGNQTRSLLQSPTKSFVGTPGLTHKKSQKVSKEKRRTSKADSVGSSPVNATWYTSSATTPVENPDVSIGSSTSESTPTNQPIFELTEELTPKRPLRSEVEREKRLSRPSSGQYSRPNSMSVTIRGTNSSGNSSNRDSVGTTDSSVSEEDPVPPPLPAKNRDSEMSSISSTTSTENVSFLHYRYSMTNARIPSIQTDDFDVPPSPPPKPPKNKNHNSVIS